MFGSALASPWNELKEMTAFLFGVDELPEGASYSRYPAPFNPFETIKPPAMNTLVSGEWDHYARYQAWTLFPFGLQSRDVLRTIENPADAAENLVGLPANELAERVRGEETE